MKDMKGPRAFADYINCLSILENATAHLYHALSDWTGTPVAKGLLLNIALDSTKHATLLKSISDSLAASKTRSKDCAKNLNEVWQLTDSLRKEIERKQKGNKLELSKLIDELTSLESTLGEEYYIFVQMKNLAVLSKKINELYSVKLSAIRTIINSIIRDEERHREILSTIKQLLSHNKETETDNTPIVRFQNPDAWVHV